MEIEFSETAHYFYSEFGYIHGYIHGYICERFTEFTEAVNETTLTA